MRVGLFIIIFFTAVAAAAQRKKDKESYYVYDSAWKPCQPENAKFLGYLVELDDTTYRWNFYNYKGLLMSVETYRDKDAQIPNGYFAWYDTHGIIDSSGYSANGKKDGKWYTYSDTLSVMMEQEYNKGKLIKTTDYTDPSYKRSTPDTDSLPGDHEAGFKGGITGWRKYLERNYQYPARALSIGQYGTVTVDFMVDSTGKIIVSKISRSVELSIDQEAIRLIRESKDWVPAIRMGKPVNAYRRQPITFSKQE